MTAIRVDVIDRSSEKAQVWLNELAVVLGTPSPRPLACCAAMSRLACSTT